MIDFAMHSALESNLWRDLNNNTAHSSFAQWIRHLQESQILAKLRKSNGEWDPEDKSYYEYVGEFGIPFALFGVLCVLIFLGIVTGLCCYRRSSSRSRSSRNIVIQQIPSRTNIVVSRIVLLIFILLLACGLCVGVFSTMEMRSVIRDTTTTLTNTQTVILQDVLDIRDLVKQLNASKYVTPQLTTTIQWIINTNNQTQQYKLQANQASDTGQIVLTSMFGVGLFLAVIGLIAVVTFCSRISCCSNTATVLFLIFGCVYLLVICCIGGASFSGSVFIADMCPVVDQYIHNKTRNNETAEWMEFYLHCVGENPLDEATVTVQFGILEYSIQLNYTKEHYPEKKQEIAELTALITKLESLYQLLLKISDCNIIATPWAQAKSYVCDNLLNALFICLVASMTSAVCLFAALCAGAKQYVTTKDRHRQVAYRPINEDLSDLPNSIFEDP